MKVQYAVFHKQGKFHTPWSSLSADISDAKVVRTDHLEYAILKDDGYGYDVLTFWVDWGVSPSTWFEEFNDSWRPGTRVAGWMHSTTLIAKVQNLDDPLRISTDARVYPALSNIDATDAMHRNIPGLLNAIVSNAWKLSTRNPVFEVREVITSA